ncbi:hypothetical protein SJAV_00330 [Sulfurisphaera javensis]|uniref:MFS transporter n=1 Tax=Sulfurisphaera javensis TaxID=2049879 RepID=A0AAT9GMT6_9CREN
MRKNFLLSSWLFGFANGLSSPLISLYIYVTSSIYFSLKFLLFTSLFLLFAYFISGYFSKEREVITFYKIGISLYIIFYTLLAIFNINSYKYVDILSIIYGFAQGFYWYGWDVIFYNTPKKLNFFNKSAYLGFISSLLAPAIYGTILTLFHKLGYLLLFLSSSALLIVVILLAENMKVKGVFNFKDSFLVITKNENYKNTMISLSLIAGFNYITGNINPIILYSFTRNYLDFSLINYVLNAVSLTSIYLVRQRYVSKVKPYNIVLLSSLAISFSSFSLFFFPLMYLIVYNFFSPLIYPIIDIYNWNNMDRNYLINYLINRQIFLNVSRILSATIDILVFSSFDVISLVPLLLLASIIFYRKRKVAVPLTQSL